MSLRLQAFGAGLEEAWDAFCGGAVNASFLHTRRFLAYHGPRFKDASLLVRDDERLVGLLPAAEAEAGWVSSHPGATYGGLVHDGWLSGNRMLEALQLARAHYAAAGYRHLRYKAVPSMHAPAPAQDDLYALFRLGARRTRCDLACAVPLGRPRAVSERRRRGLKKALAKVVLSDDWALMPALWRVIADNLSRKHAVAPVHTEAELARLRELFPDEIRLLCALVDGRVEAGVVFFNSKTAWHCQYTASSEKGYDISALDAVQDAALGFATRAGAQYLDFGISTEDNGLVLNDGLYRFKSEFGGGGVVHEFYELDLNA